MSSSRRSGSVSWNSRRHSGLRARDLLRRRAGLPDAQEPDPVEAHLDQAIQFGVGNIVQCGGPAQFLGQFRQPDASVDLIERRIATTRSWASV